MRVVALVRAPANPEAAVTALASAAGMAPAEARMRLAPEPPALLARLAPDAAEALVAKLRQAGLAVLAVDEQRLAEQERPLARGVTFGPSSVTFTPRAGPPLELAWDEVLVILRGASSVRTQSEHSEKTRSLALGKALVTGGLAMTRTGEKTVRGSQEETSQVIFVLARDGRGAVLSEHAVDFSCLGPHMQPVRTANMGVLAKLLRERAPGAYFDERLLRLGRRPLPFVVGGTVQVSSGGVSQTRASTAQGLDVLAEVLRQAVAQGLLT
jgi:hypothetical protein